jgi:hypothetical protein
MPDCIASAIPVAVLARRRASSDAPPITHSISSPLTTRKIKTKHANKFMTGALHQNRATFGVTG